MVCFIIIFLIFQSNAYFVCLEGNTIWKTLDLFWEEIDVEEIDANIVQA
jgi:hypothetical protein